MDRISETKTRQLRFGIPGEYILEPLIAAQKPVYCVRTPDRNCLVTAWFRNNSDITVRCRVGVARYKSDREALHRLVFEERKDLDELVATCVAHDYIQRYLGGNTNGEATESDCR